MKTPFPEAPVGFWQDHTCPHCKTEHNAVAAVMEPKPPVNGDLSICTTCGQLSIFVVSESRSVLRKPTADEIEEFKSDPDLWASIEYAQRQHANRRAAKEARN